MEAKRAREASSDSLEAPELKPSASFETLAEVPRRRSSGQKRKAPSTLPSSAAASFPTPKRLIKERNALNIPSSVHNGPWTRARQFPGKLAAGSPQTPQDGVVAVDTPAGDAGKEIFVPEEQVKFGEESVSPQDVATVDEDFEAVRSRGVGVHVVPTSAGWFSWKKIHELERQALHSFFNGQSGSRTPEIYVEIRDFIMRKFHFDPQTPVEGKDLSEMSVGDLGARKEVMAFLDHWGLINFHPFPHCIGDATEPEVEADKTSSPLNRLYQFEVMESLPPPYVPKKLELSPPPVLPNLAPESSLLEDMMRPADPSVEFHCNSCSADCSRKRYHCQKQADFDLCADCYNNGKFGSGMTPADFIVMESAEGPGVSGRNWTDQETLLLLEALELFGENWNEIAEHVATKTKAQCILHFLQMPIEDPFLEVKENANLNILEKTEPCLATMDSFPGNIPDAMDHDSVMCSDQPVSSPGDVSGGKHTEVDLSSETCSTFAVEVLKLAFQAVGFTDEAAKPSSFAEAGNPIMILAAFLAGLVDQDTVTTSSRNSLKTISEESPGTQLVSRHCFILDDPPSDAKSPLPQSVIATLGDGEVVKVESQLPTPNGSTILNNGMENSQPNLVSEHSEKEQLASSDVLTKASTEKELSSFLPKDAATCCFELSDDKPLPKEQTLQSDRKDASIFVEPVVAGISNSKDLEDLSGQGGDAPSMVHKNLDLPKVECTMPPSIDLEEEEPQHKNDAASTLDFDEVAVRDENKTFSPKNDRNISTIASSPHYISSISRAAVSLLSAAAVKAKLLADQEEDQIQQLVTCMIDKQLHKLEIKLAFFPEFENMIVRAKEQTERARQKLMNERSQIIAAKLGYSQPSSRSYSTSLTNSKLAVGYGHMGIRPPPGMTYQKPPPPRRP